MDDDGILTSWRPLVFLHGAHTRRGWRPRTGDKIMIERAYDQAVSAKNQWRTEEDREAAMRKLAKMKDTLIAAVY